jgi:DNA polymerase III subunit gamma/tau
MTPSDAHDSTAHEAATSGAYQVVARRYRPQRFADLVGQEHVARGLSGAIASGRIGHAYLFTGARGVGKTSAARIFAKALACERGPAAEPCNACDACRAIAAGQDVDVVEIDAASNRGIDEIRQLRQNVAVRPARGRFKIYIIDEVHMLTREAFNALLKTLEEPPGHVKFVLCTTEPEKLPITILSRCQRFDFTTVDTPAIARRLAQIVEAEGIEVAPEALTLIARRAAGSMRDSQSLLEQLLGSAAGTIGVDEVHALIGTGREERVGALVAAIAAREPARALAALASSLETGADPGGVLDQVIAALRDALLASVGCEEAMLTQSSGLGVDLAAIGREVGTPSLLAMLQILDQSLARMRTSGHAALLAEMAVIRLAMLEDLESLSSAVDRLAAAGPGPQAAPASRPVASGQPRAPVQPVAPPVAAPAQKKTTDVTVADTLPAVVAPAPQTAPPDPAPPPAPGLPADALAAWLTACGSLEGLAADFAREAVGAAWQDDVLEVTLPAHAAAAQSFLRRPDVAAAIANAFQALAGRRVVHRLVLAAAAPAATSAAGGDAPRRTAPPQSQAALVREVAEHPLVARARTVFDAAIRKVDPPRARPAAVAAPASGAAAVSAPAVEDELDHDRDDMEEP